MKKFFVICLLALIPALMFGQAKINKCVSVATATTPLGTQLNAGDRVFCVATGNEYILTATAAYTATVTTIIASGNYSLFTTYSATPSLTTLTTSGAATIGGLLTVGVAGADGSFKLYSEQGATDYYVTLNPNSAMTSAANFYLPADEPSATYPVTCTTGGVLGYNDQAVATTSSPTFVGATLAEGAGTSNIFSAYNDKTTAGDSGVVINKLGYVGICKATASVPLDVVGSASVSGTTTAPTIAGDTATFKKIKFTAITDTTAKRTGLIMIGTSLYWGNGTYYYKIK